MSYSKIFLSLVVLTQFTAHGAEVDQFTNRDKFLKDSAELINQKGNNAILSAVNIANDRNLGCNEDILYKELQGYFSNHYKGKLVIDILSDKAIDQRSVAVNESVYQDWTSWDGVGIGLKVLSTSGITMSGVVRMGEQEVGTDKFEHMFGQGYNYFKKNYLHDRGIVKTVKSGVFGEKYVLGGQKVGNGVFSFGDLSANFNGMRMWNHMLQKNDDILGSDHNLGPYIACVNNEKWAQVKEIDFRNYMDASMDESINCSKFPTTKTAKKFANRVKSMGMSCPMDISKRDDLVVKYKDMAKWIINTDGTSRLKFLEFKDK